MKLLNLIALLATASSAWAFQPTLSNKINYVKNIHHSRKSASALFSTIAYGGLVDISTTAARDCEILIDWATSCGVQKTPGLELEIDTNPHNVDEEYDFLDFEDISLRTTEDLPSGSPVLLVPNEMILSSFKVYEEIGSLEEAEEVLEKMNASDKLPHFYLAVKILMEYEKGQDSPWYPWLNSLPRHFFNGASMTPLCYQSLPPLVASLVIKEQGNFFRISSAIAKVPFLSEELTTDKDLVKWIIQIAYTRAFEATDGSGDLRIAPVADMFNHGTYANVEITYDEEGNCFAQTATDVPAGSPLTISYGDPTNPSFLLARYGFLDKSSPATFCKIMIDDPSDELVDMGYDHSRMLFYTESGETSEEVWDVLLYQVLQSSPETQAAFYQAHQTGDLQTKQSFHEQFYQQTALKLQTHIDTFLSQLEVLRQRSKGKNLKEHPRLPLIWQHNALVKATLLAVKDRYFRQGV